MIIITLWHEFLKGDFSIPTRPDKILHFTNIIKCPWENSVYLRKSVQKILTALNPKLTKFHNLNVNNVSFFLIVPF